MAEQDRLRLAVIIASTRAGRFGPTVAGWFTACARRRRELDVDVIDLAATDLPQRLSDAGEPAPPAVARLAPRLARADAFAVVTPEYNRSVPAPLKSAIDWYCDEWRAKAVTVVAYGRESGGRYASDHLRQIFAELHAVTVRDTVSLPCFWDDFAADGGWPRRDAPCHAAARTTLDQLTWWAYALRDARHHRTFPA